MSFGQSLYVCSGNIVSDAKVAPFGDGKFMSFRLGVTRPSQGNTTRTQYVDVLTSYNEEKISRFVKGAAVQVHGPLTEKPYADKQGNPRVQLSVRANLGDIIVNAPKQSASDEPDDESF